MICSKSPSVIQIYDRYLLLPKVLEARADVVYHFVLFHLEDEDGRLLHEQSLPLRRIRGIVLVVEADARKALRVLHAYRENYGEEEGAVGGEGVGQGHLHVGRAPCVGRPFDLFQGILLLVLLGPSLVHLCTLEKDEESGKRVQLVVCVSDARRDLIRDLPVLFSSL